jgi:hypothetical protein
MRHGAETGRSPARTGLSVLDYLSGKAMCSSSAMAVQKIAGGRKKFGMNASNDFT